LSFELITDLFGIELPIIQAPMAGSQGSALTIAVSTAGGLGSLPCALLKQDQIRSELERIRAATSGPFNLNFFCHTSPPFDAARDTAWRSVLARYYEEFGLEPPAGGMGGARLPFDEDAAAIIEEFRPVVVSFHFGVPRPALLARVKATGAKVLSSATTIAEARWLEANGVDAIIAQGMEAGGHRGMFLEQDLATQIETMALVRQTVGAVGVPVIAAGGIADAKDVAAAFAAGAAGVQVGTAYLLCPEATTGRLHREALKTNAVRSTTVTNVLTGRPARGIINRLMREIGPMNNAAPAFPMAAAYVAPLRAAAEAQGRNDFSTMWCGQNAGGCREVSAEEITRELASRV
jgi:nitronate monooxygenase